MKLVYKLVLALLAYLSTNSYPQVSQIQNGGFEQDWTNWTHVGSMFADDRFPTRAHTGTHYAYLSNPDGTPGNNLNGGFGQTVFIPANASTAELKFYYSINTSETGTAINDAFLLYLNNIGTEVLISNVGQPPIGGAVVYTQITYPLLDFKGTNVSISIAAVTNSSNPTVFRFDDFSISIIVDVADEGTDGPVGFDLKQNYPNPFNPSTTISYSIQKTCFVSLKVYDILGNEVATIVSEEKAPGIYYHDFDASNLTSGIYIYRIKAGQFIDTKKFILTK